MGRWLVKYYFGLFLGRYVGGGLEVREATVWEGTRGTCRAYGARDVARVWAPSPCGLG